MLTVTACATVTNTTPDGESLQALAEVAARRVQLADVVAAAKWDTDSSIDDPVREKAVLAGAVLDQITDGLLTQLKATRTVRAGPGCAAELAAARHQAEQARALDVVHRDALGRALASVCRRGTPG